MTPLRPRDEWTEADGDVLWYRWPVEDDCLTPYVGSPLDNDWDDVNLEYLHYAGDGERFWYTHWIPLPDVFLPAESIEAGSSEAFINQVQDS